MKINISHLGLSFALLSAPVASQLVGGAMTAPPGNLIGGAMTAPPGIKCQVSDGLEDPCPENAFCSFASGMCVDLGTCSDPKDCTDPNNPVMLASCVGTITCDGGMCGINCHSFCETDSDCADVGREPHHCASDGICEPQGGCASEDDCFKDSNQGYPVAPCFGKMECNERTCSMNCGGGSDALFECTTSADCPFEGEYCTTNGICRPGGACMDLEDCSLPDNNYPIIECIGELFCENSMCGKECGTFGDKQDSADPVKCVTSKDCPQVGEMGQYCSNRGICQPGGSCFVEEDCSILENIYIKPACVGKLYCEDNTCGINCGELPDPIDQQPVFSAPGAIPGEEIDELNEGQEGSVVIVGRECASDADCVSALTARDADAGFEEMYCAQGVCMEQGTCETDMDCVNPANIFWNDKRCMGYLYCTEMGTCDRVCGEECKEGEGAVNCFVNPCDVGPLCPGAVSCTMWTCDGECGAKYFDASGGVVDCSPTGNDTKVAMADSSATAILSYSALLLAALVAVVV